VAIIHTFDCEPVSSLRIFAASDFHTQFFFLSAPPSTVISWPWCGVSVVQSIPLAARNHTCHEACINKIQGCIRNVLGPACAVRRMVVDILFADLAFPVCALLITYPLSATSSHSLHMNDLPSLLSWATLILPGAIRLTLIPNGPKLIAIECISPSWPALLEA
jgi:hypothetical protein